MADTQIHPTGVVSAPGDFVIPSSTELILKAAYASFDGTGAAGDFLPLLRVISDAGTVVVESVADTTVTAGGSVDASWFPRVGSGRGAPGDPSPTSEVYVAASYVNLPDSTLAPLNVVASTYAPGIIPVFAPIPLSGNPLVLTWAARGNVAFTLIADWPAGNYDRYVEAVVANPADPTNYSREPRLRGSVSPDSDRQTLSFLVSGIVGPPATTVTIEAYQASGATKTVTAQMFGTSFPYTLA